MMINLECYVILDTFMYRFNMYVYCQTLLSCKLITLITHHRHTYYYLAGGDIRQKLEFHHIHLELGALGYIETFLFYWSWGFFPKKNPPWPIFVFENTRVPPLDLKKYFF